MPRLRGLPFARLLVAPLAAALLVVLAAAGPVEDFARAMRAGAYDDAARIGLAIAEARPQDAIAAYNLACALSRAKRTDESITWLLKSAGLGFAGVRSIRDDEDLANARANPDYERVRQAVQANADTRFAEFRAMAEAAEPIVILPPDHDPARAAPLIIALHGTGGTGRFMADLWTKPAAAHGAIVIAPDALRPVRGTDGYGWTFRDESEWYVLRLIDEAKKKWAIGPVVLTGFSQGANISLMLGQSHADRFAGVIPVAGHYETDVADVPADDPRPRWYLLIGAQDPWARTYTDAKRDFERVGMDVRVRRLRGVGHDVPRGERGEKVLRDALAWVLKGVRSGVPAPGDPDQHPPQAASHVRDPSPDPPSRPKAPPRG